MFFLLTEAPVSHLQWEIHEVEFILPVRLIHVKLASCFSSSGSDSQSYVRHSCQSDIWRRGK